MSNLQIILISVFIIALIGGVLIFAGVIPTGSSTPTGATGNVVLWGTIDSGIMSTPIDDLNRADKTYRIIYVQKDPATFDADLTEALASGAGPDLFFLPSDQIIHDSDKASLITYTAVPQATFNTSYISEGSLYETAQGILALPFTVDPLVMYYNKDILEGAGVVNPPQTWDDFNDLVKSVTVLGPSKNIIRSAVAFGTYANVNYAKDILSAMLIQKSNPIVSLQAGLSGYVSHLSDSLGGASVPLSDILSFYTSFSNSVDPNYSWNPALPTSLDDFIAGNLGIYFGYASELPAIQAKNPNLNFSVARLPQTKGSSVVATFGRINAIAVSKASKNIATAYTALYQLTASAFSGKIAIAAALPPVTRDLLANKPHSPDYLSVFYDSALISRAWLDPSTSATDAIFQNMIEDVTSGRLSVDASVIKGNDSLNLLLRRQ